MKPRPFVQSAALVLLAAAALAFAMSGKFIAYAQDTSALTVRIVGARNANGKIGVALFEGPPGFPGDASKAIRRQNVAIDSSSLNSEVVFRNLPHGAYAVSVFHDENGNGKLDKNMLGVPKEGYGASNNPKRRMGPPSFDEAKFTVTQPDQTIEIKLMY